MSSPDTVPSKSAIEFWSGNPKLISRDSFLQIAEFIAPKPRDKSMPVLRNVLAGLSPTGGEFFEGYIHMKPRFVRIVDKFSRFDAD